MSDISDITLRIRVDIINSAAILALVNNMNKVDGASRRMRDSVTATANKTSIWNKAFDKVVGHLKSVEQKFDAVFRAGVHMQAMGRDLLGFAKKVAGAGKALVDSWGEFQFTLNRAAAAADIFDTQSPLYDKLRESVNKAAHELRVFPAQDVAKGLYFWQSTTGKTIKTQADLESTMKNVTAVMKVAAMTDTSYEQAIKGVYATLKQFNKGTEETANVSALLFYATQKTALEFPDLINSLKMTGAVAGNAKEPLESMVAVLGAIGNAGIRGSQAGRALRQTYIKIVRPTKAAKETLDKLFKSQGGYNKVAFDSKGNFIGIEKYVTKLSAAMKGLNYQQKANIIATITTANELPVMTQMIAAADRAGRNWVDTFADQQKATEAFEGSWKNLATSWKGVIGGIKNAVNPVLQELGKSIADLLTPALEELNVVIWDNVPAFQDLGREVVQSFKPVVEGITKVIKKVIAWATANPKLMKSLGKWFIIGTIFSAIAGAVLLASGTLVTFLSSVVLVIAGMLPLFAILGVLGVILATFIVRVYQNVGGIQKVLKDFGAAVVRIFKLFVFGTEDAQAGATDLFKTFDKYATGAVQFLAKWLGKITDVLNNLTPQDVATLKGAVRAILGLIAARKALSVTADTIRGVSGAFKDLQKDAKTAAGAVKTSINGIKSAASGVQAGFKIVGSAGSGLLDFFKTLLPSAISVAVAAFTALDVAIGPVGWAILAVSAIIAAAVVAYETNFLGFKDFVDGLVQWFIDNVVPVIQQAIEFLAPIIAQIVSSIGDFIGTVIGIVQGLIDFFANLPQNIQNFINELINNIVNFLTEFGKHWDYWLGYVLGRIIAFPISVLITIVKFGIDLISNIVGFLSKLPGMFWDWFTKVLGTLADWFGQAIPAVAKWAGDLIGGIIDWFSKLPGRVLNFLGEVWTNLSNWFIDNAPKIAKAAGDFIAGVLQFFKDLPTNIVNALKDLPTTLANIFKGLADLGGKVIKAIMDVGEAIVRGLWEGIKNMAGWFVDKITGFFGGLIDGIKDQLGIQSPSKVFASIGDQMIAGLGRGIEKADAAHKAMNNVIADLTDTATTAVGNIGLAATGNLSGNVTTDATRRVELVVDVKSSDGSVNSMDMNTLASLITGSDMVRALERMSTVD